MHSDRYKKGRGFAGARRGNFGQERERIKVDRYEQLNAGRYKIKGSKSLTVKKSQEVA